MTDPILDNRRFTDGTAADVHRGGVGRQYVPDDGEMVHAAGEQVVVENQP